jgi:thiol-disulfide isomerase/thioredoxin
VTPGIVVLVVAVLAALAFGGYRAVVDGRFRGTRQLRHDATAEPTAAPAGPSGALADTPFADRLGDRATLLQFSSAFCAPCRATRRVLADVAGRTDGVAHVELDAEQHLDLVRRLGILRTPTTLVLDPRGHEVTRAAGAPTRQQVLAALEAVAR